MSSDLLQKYFPELTPLQKERFEALLPLYAEWNKKINVVSRKDIDSLMERHILHSLALAKFGDFYKGSKVLDIGTGGGFPGIPLAILFESVSFQLIDSIGKKIMVVNEVINSLGLENVMAEKSRGEQHNGKYEVLITRATMKMEPFVNNFKHLTYRGKSKIMALKGGDLTKELSSFQKNKISEYSISDIFEEEFFETKKVVVLDL